MMYSVYRPFLLPSFKAYIVLHHFTELLECLSDLLFVIIKECFKMGLQLLRLREWDIFWEVIDKVS